MSLEKRQSDQNLAVALPSSSVSRQRPLRVLEEDDYYDALSFIIRRDFFPQLHENELRKQQESELLESIMVTGTGVMQDPDQSVRTNMTQTPFMNNDLAQTPAWAGETPQSRRTTRSSTAASRNNDSGNGNGNLKQTSMSLTSFLSTYTSEDNASFSEILDSVNEKRRKKNSWAYENETYVNSIEKESRDRRTKLIEMVSNAAERGLSLKMIEGAIPGKPGERIYIQAPEDQKTTITGDRQSIEHVKQKMITDGESSQSSSSQQLLIEAGSSSQEEEKGQGQGSSKQVALVNNKTSNTSTSTSSNDTNIQPGRTELWPFKTRNSLYFMPDIDSASVSNIPKAKADSEAKSIQHANTQLSNQYNDDNEFEMPPSPSSTQISDAIRGDVSDGLQTPRVRGYGFVDSIPSPSPSMIGKSGANQLMTFGTISSAPVALHTSSSKKNAKNDEARQFGGPFKIAATPRREILAHQMASETARKKRKKENETLQSMVGNATPANRTPARLAREGSMTPAARRLLNLTRTPNRNSNNNNNNK